MEMSDRNDGQTIGFFSANLLSSIVGEIYRPNGDMLLRATQKKQSSVKVTYIPSC